MKTSMSKITTIKFGEDLRDRIEDQLEYGDSLSGWVRDACRLKLDLKNDADEEIAQAD